MIQAVPSVAAMSPYQLASLDGNSVSLAQNESAFAPSPRTLSVLQHYDGAPYPDPDWRVLRSAIARTHQLEPDHILCGAGSMELIGALIRAFAGPHDSVVGSEYGYLYVATACQQAATRYFTAPEREFQVSVDALRDAVRPDTRIVVVCNPGNPSGTRIPNADIVRLRQALPEQVLLIVDQAYGEFDDQDPAPIWDLVARGDTVVTRSFSKAYALASARVGWGYFPEAIALQVRKLLNANNISSISQALAVAVLDDAEHMHELVRRTATLRDQFWQRLCDAGYRCPRSYSNFVLIPFENRAAAEAADRALRAAGYILRQMGGYGLGHCLRATIIAEMDPVAEILIRLQDPAATEE